MKTILIAALLLFAFQDKPLKDLLEIKLADTWTMKDVGDGWTQLLPPGIAGPHEAGAGVRGGVPFEGTWWASHKKTWNAMRDGFGMKDLDPVIQIPGGPGDFIVSSGRWSNGTVSAKVRLYTARSDKSLVAVLWTGQNFGTWDLQTWTLDRMLQSAVVKGAPARVTPKIAEAYQCVRLHTTYYPNGRTESKARNDRLVLYDNGVADRSLGHDEGYDTAPTWKVDPDLDDSTYGRWKASGQEIHATFVGKTEVLTRDGSSLRSGTDEWKPMLRVDGLKLTGRFVLPASNPISFIEFTADGKFSMENVLYPPIVEGNLQKVPAKGSGTYEIRNWTLHLKMDGCSQRQDFLIMEGDVKTPESIWLRLRMYKREK